MSEVFLVKKNQAQILALAPGAGVGLIVDGSVTSQAYGQLTYQSDSQQVTADTVYDLASVTKAVTTILVSHLIKREKLQLETLVGELIPDAGPAVARLTIHDLLSYRPLLSVTLSQLKHLPADEIVARVKHADVTWQTDSPVFHNGVALLLGWLVEAVTGLTLDQVAQEVLFNPLQMKNTGWRPRQGMIAPTEDDPWRGRLLIGETHDESAWVLAQAGLTPGSAGLFSTVPDLLALAHRLLAYPLAENPWLVLVDNQILGWEQPPRSWLATSTSDLIVGKTGFTGCLLALNFSQSRALVLLSNAVHPDRTVVMSDKVNRLRQHLVTKHLLS